MWAFALEEVQTMRYVSGRTKHESRGQQNGSPIKESEFISCIGKCVWNT